MLIVDHTIDPLKLILSGQYELCLTRDGGSPFIRNAGFKRADKTTTPLKSYQITDEQAKEIRKHGCVVKGLQGCLLHFHTRRWPVNPESETCPK